MKKILIIIGKLYVGGAERIARDIGYYADPHKYKIHYLVYGNEIGAYESELKEQGCAIHHMDSPSDGYISYYKKLKALIKNHKFDVIHSHTMFSSGWAMLIGRRLGVPIRISHSHTIRGPEKRNILKNAYEHIMRKVVIWNSTQLVACGKSAGDWFYGSMVYEKRGTLIYNGIGLKEFEYNEDLRERLRKQYDLENKFVIGHVGHLATVKNQIFLINLMPDILKMKPNAMLLLLGDGADKKMLEQCAQELGIDHSVKFTGNVKNVGEFMNTMDVFVFPSLYEGMPLAMVEAQTNGLPCCISDKIPKDIYLTDLVHACSLDTPEIWIKTICDLERRNSNEYSRRMYKMGFDTKEMLKKIYTMYEGGSNAS